MKIVYRTYESIEVSRKSFGNTARKKRVVAWITP